MQQPTVTSKLLVDFLSSQVSVHMPTITLPDNFLSCQATIQHPAVTPELQNFEDVLEFEPVKPPHHEAKSQNVPQQ